MNKMILSYVIIIVLFVAIDMFWLMGIARATYVAEMGALLKKQPNIIAAIIFYLAYALGLWFFAVRPGLDAGSWLTAASLGAAIGAMAYGTYDFTNLSVIEGYGWRIAIIDLIWGTVLSAVTAGLSTRLTMALGI
jgi:uncharacterized membrane protein